MGRKHDGMSPWRRKRLKGAMFYMYLPASE
jgi:hypothetical protein